MSDNMTTQKVTAFGGLYTSSNDFWLSDEMPGAATRLINYEVGLTGGYRRINGFSKFDATYYNVDDTNAEGPILGLFMYKTNSGGTEYFAARKQKSGTTYKWYKFQSGVGWVAQTTGLTHNTTGGGVTVNRIRHVQFNFGSGNTICLVDGVNHATLYNGTSWINIDPAATGADYANSGGTQAYARPSFVTVFQRHLFMGGDISYLSGIAHSAPGQEYDWTPGGGGGQVQASHDLIQMKSFRDENFLFAEDAIQKIIVDSSNAFALKDVTTNIGCLAPDSVVELGGDLLFLSPDGFRPIAGTAKIGDIEIESVSNQVQNLIKNIIEGIDLSTLNAVVLRKKSQVRFFYGGLAAEGIIGGLRLNEGQVDWEWGQLLGIEAHVCDSAFVGGDEVILHGTTTGNIYKQESGNDFDGSDVLSVYSPPFLDQGDVYVRKQYRTLKAFVRPEGTFQLDLSLAFDWKDPTVATPGDFSASSTGASVVYNGLGIIYGGSGVVYGGSSAPLMHYDIEGEAFSIRPSFVSLGTDAPHSIQGFALELTEEGRI